MSELLRLRYKRIAESMEGSPEHRLPLDKQGEKIERFRRKVDWAASVQQVPCWGVARECTESDAQNDLRFSYFPVKK